LQADWGSIIIQQMRTYSMGLHDNDESMILNRNMGAGAVEGQSNPEFGDPSQKARCDGPPDGDRGIMDHGIPVVRGEALHGAKRRQR
jgi:hypothetical protein